MTTLLIATRNAHKIGEIRAILGDNFRYLTLSNFSSVPAVVEDAATFAGNATKKATELARWLATRSDNHQPSTINFVLADDSGLEVDALHGAPGVFSARFAASDATGHGNAPDKDNNAKLLRLLGSLPPEQRTARFRCVLALTPILKPSPESNSPVCSADECELQTELFDGVCEGRIGFSPSGQGGFGYDPLFVPDGFDQTFAELGETTKNQLSHRSKALAQLKLKLDRLR